MGCVAVSSFSFDDYCKTAEYKEWENRLQTTQLSRSDMRKIHNMFQRIDIEGKGRVHHLDLSKNLVLEETRFTERVLCMLCDNDLGELSFVQFLFTLYTFCTLTKEELVSFVFNLYDTDGCGTVPSTSIVDMIQDFYKCSVTHSLISTIVTNEFKAMDQAKLNITLDTFRAFTENHQGLLNPVYQLQHTLRTKTLGTASWERAMRKRARKRSFSEDVNAQYSQRTGVSEKSIQPRSALVRTARARNVRSVRVVSSEEKDSADVSETLTSFFLLETPLPSLRASSWSNDDNHEDFSLIDQA